MKEGNINIDAVITGSFWILLLILFFYYGYRNDFKFRKRESVYNAISVLIALIVFVLGYFYLALITGILGGILKPRILGYLDNRKKIG